MSMDGETEPVKDALPGEPSGGDDSPSETYTSEQVRGFLSDRHSTLDSQIIALTKDNAGLQATAEAKDTELTNAAEDNQKLQSQIQELSSNDPKKFDVIKKEWDITERERKLTTARASLETEKQTHGERVTLAELTLKEISINEIAAGYEGGDPVALKKAIEKLETDFGISIKTDEQIKMAIPSTWAKKPPDTLVLVSTKGTGGADALSNTPEAKVTRALTKLAKK